MGIKGLFKYIEKNVGHSGIGIIPVSKLSGCRVAIDTSFVINEIVRAMRSSGNEMTNNEGQLTNHLHGLFYRILKFLQFGIIPIFIFDGAPPNIKSNTLESRSKVREDAIKKLEELSDSEDEDRNKLLSKATHIGKQEYSDARILLDLMGIPWINAPGEADVVCAWMATKKFKNGKRMAKGVCSNDSDMLVLGTQYLFKDMLKFLKNNTVKVITLDKCLKKLNLSMDQFVDFCILLGSDYNNNLKGIGPKKSYQNILEYDTLENVLENEGYDIENDIKENVKNMLDAKNYFKTAFSELEKTGFSVDKQNLKIKKFKYDELIDFLCVRHQFNTKRVKTALDRMTEYYNNMNIIDENTTKYEMISNVSRQEFELSLSENIIMLSDSESDKSEEIITKKNSKKHKQIRTIIS